LGLVIGFQTIARVITKRTEAEQLLRESEMKYRTLVEQSLQGIVIIQDFHIVFANQAFVEICGYTIDELLSLSPDKIKAMVHPQDQALVWGSMRARLEGKPALQRYEFRGMRKDGEMRWLAIYPKVIQYKGKPAVQGTIIDRTERKRAEEALQESEEKFRTLAEKSPNMIFINRRGRVIYANDKSAEVMGYTKDECYSSDFDFLTLIAPESIETVKLAYAKHMRGEDIEPYEYTLITKEGKKIDAILTTKLVDYEGDKAILGIVTDIAERKRAEKALKESEEKLRAFMESAPDAFALFDSALNLVMINKIGLGMFPAGTKKEDIIGKNVAELYPTIKEAGRYEKYMEVIKTGKSFHIDDISPQPPFGNLHLAMRVFKVGNGLGLIATDISERARSKEALKNTEKKFRELFDSASDAIFIHDLEGHFLEVNKTACERLGYSKEEMLKKTPMDIDTQEYAKLVPEKLKEIIEKKSLFLKSAHKTKDGRVIPIELSSRLIEFEGKPAVLSIARDVTERIKVEEKLQQSLDKLEKTIENTLQAMAKILETRDPYTAGHQQRVASLALAIAREMNLSLDQARGLQFAAVIHDIGKIYVPAEILSRPSKLTDSEFALIKIHPSVGYDILKTIEFPWPVANIILQHHERLNGSGYPKGLHDQQILLESKILAVADVVEAMSSHRPYRPAHSIEETLEEIKKNMDILYDPTVVDICRKLFIQKIFKFE
jgi:PAS domain S-box-containing protein/putative nucleotidyltransferase with HDIG domain